MTQRLGSVCTSDACLVINAKNRSKSISPCPGEEQSERDANRVYMGKVRVTTGFLDHLFNLLGCELSFLEQESQMDTRKTIQPMTHRATAKGIDNFTKFGSGDGAITAVHRLNPTGFRCNFQRHSSWENSLKAFKARWHTHLTARRHGLLVSIKQPKDGLELRLEVVSQWGSGVLCLSHRVWPCVSVLNLPSTTGIVVVLLSSADLRTRTTRRGTPLALFGTCGRS